jgi:putative FmdB family regulatory protein
MDAGLRAAADAGYRAVSGVQGGCGASSGGVPGEAQGGREAVMPVYQFRCKDCGKTFEVTCHLSERDEQAVCPDCGSRDVEPVFSSFTCAPPPKW